MSRITSYNVCYTKLLRGAEVGEAAGHAVVPARADGHDQVAGRHGLVGVGRAVHPHHPEVEGMGLVDGALAEEGVDDRRTQLLGERGDRLSRSGDHRSVTHVEQRAARLAQVVDGSYNFV